MTSKYFNSNGVLLATIEELNNGKYVSGDCRINSDFGMLKMTNVHNIREVWLDTDCVLTYDGNNWLLNGIGTEICITHFLDRVLPFNIIVNKDALNNLVTLNARIAEIVSITGAKLK